MADAATPECPDCRRLMALIERLHATYGKRIAELEARIARLEKDSSNSHKPPRQRRASFQRHSQA